MTLNLRAFLLFFSMLTSVSSPAQIQTIDTLVSPLVRWDEINREAISARASPLSALRDAVGPGDVLQISVFGSPDLSAEVVVGDNGQISLPLVGSIAVENKSSTEIATLYADRLVRGLYVKEPRVSVQVRQQRSRQISVLGEVQKPGRYPLQGRTSIVDALSLAGGLTSRADKVVTLLRRDAQGQEQEKLFVFPLRLDDASTVARQTLEQELQADDVVYVGVQKVFYIYGEVRRPGMYPLEGDINVMRALSISGGVTERGTTRRIKITREQSSGKTIELRASISEPIKPGDVIFVDERIF